MSTSNALCRQSVAALLRVARAERARYTRIAVAEYLLDFIRETLWSWVQIYFT